MLFLLLKSNINLLVCKKPLLNQAFIHYIVSFLILIVYDLTFEQKALACILAITPYGYFEMVLIQPNTNANANTNTNTNTNANT